MPRKSNDDSVLPRALRLDADVGGDGSASRSPSLASSNPKVLTDRAEPLPPVQAPRPGHHDRRSLPGRRATPLHASMSRPRPASPPPLRRPWGAQSL